MADDFGPAQAPSMLTVDIGALQRNYRLIAKRVEPAECAAVVKADAYGVGIEPVSRALAAAGCRTFFVATLDEAIALRSLQPTSAIYYLNGLMQGDAAICHAHDIRPTLNDPAQIERWTQDASAHGEALAAALHIDTGMARLGLTPKETAQLAAEPERLAGYSIACLLSHLACADTPDDPMNVRQRDLFAAAADTLPIATRSLAASSGAFLGPAWHFDMVRAGVSLYGVSPHPGHPNPMEQVIQLQGKILQTRDVDTPQTVGYGAAHRFEGPTRVATVAAGYADGYPRSLSNAGVVYFGKIAAPIVGRVSMDLITIDISKAPDAKPGDMVDLIGPHNDLDTVAAAAGTIGYELLTRLGRRYRRRYIENTA